MSQRSKLLTATAIAFLLLGTGCSKTDNTNNTKTDSTEKEKETETTVSVENQIAFTELTLIDGVSTTAKPNHSVIIDTVKGTIVDVFESNTKTLNENLKVENMQGKTMMPGLIEGHFHLASGVEEDTKEGESSLKNMFRQGITTVRDMAGNGTALKNLKQMAQAPETTYPKVYFVSLIIGQDFIDNDPRVKSTLGSSVAGEVPWFNALDDATAVEALIEEAKAYGCSGLKLYADITGDNAKRMNYFKKMVLTRIILLNFLLTNIKNKCIRLVIKKPSICITYVQIKKNLPLYYLAFYSKNPRGIDFFKKIQGYVKPQLKLDL